MRKNELDLSVLKNSFEALSQRYEDFRAEKAKMKLNKTFLMK